MSKKHPKFTDQEWIALIYECKTSSMMFTGKLLYMGIVSFRTGQNL